MKSFFKGLRFRLTLVYSSLFGVFICAFAYLLSSQYLQLLRQDFDEALLNFGIDITRSDDLTPGFGARLKLSEIEARKELPFSIGSTVYLLRDMDGSTVGRGAGAPEDLDIPFPTGLASERGYTHDFLDVTHNDLEYRAVNIKMINARGKERILQVATPSLLLTEQENRLILMNLLTIPLVILVSSILSYLVAGNALSPIKGLTSAASSIAAENLSQRVPEVETDDEVAELSMSFNKLLERLEKSFRAQEKFVANASHQLNTPLAIIKGELDLLESRSRTPEEEARFRTSLREEVERLIDLVKKLLLISRVEAGHADLVLGELRVDELLLSTTSRLGTLARKKRITIRFNVSEDLEDNSLLVTGDRQLLDAMFENLLENAIKYAPEETTVTIDVESSPGGLVVSVSDEGPGMSLESWKRMIQNRYQRGEGITLPGTGIGLSIVLSIAELHRASLEMRPRMPQGSKILIAFPQQKAL